MRPAGIRTIIHRLSPVVSIALFGVALWILHRELAGKHLAEIGAYLTALPLERLLLAFGFTFLGFLALSGYDWLGFRYLGVRLSYPRVALASFIGFAFSNLLGQALLTGLPLRMRLYSAWKVRAEDAAKVLAFCLLTFWLGVITLSGLAFSFSHLAMPPTLHLPFASLRPLGWLCLAVVVSYLLAGALHRGPVGWRSWSLELPRPRTALTQMALGSLDLCLCAAVLYTLLPAHESLPFAVFLTAYLASLVLGLLSLVPGGLGVFESAMVLLLGSALPKPALLGAMLAFRAIYYLLPLVVATLLMVFQEVWRGRVQLGRAARSTGRWAAVVLPAVVPNLLALSTFLGGVVLLFSGATPAVSSRLHWLDRLLPLPVIEISHFLGSLVGVGLLLLARGLQRRLDAAYHLATALLGVGIAVSLLKGFDWEEAILLGVMFAALIACREQLRRRASLRELHWSPGWVAAVVGVLLAAAWLAVFAFRHVEYSGDLWWRFALDSNAPRSLRALVGAATLALVVIGARWLRPAGAQPTPPSSEDLDRAAEIAAASPRTEAWLALLGDKTLLFSEAGNAFLMYAVEGRSWVALGGAIGPAEEVRELVWRFRDLCEEHGGWPVFYQVPDEDLYLYVDLGLGLLKLGEAARVPLASFSLEGGSKKELRYVLRRAERDGFRFDWLEKTQVLEHLDELEQVSDAWLTGKSVREKGFSVGFFDRAYLARFPVVVVRSAAGIVAFANVWLGGDGEELSIDLMRHTPEAPNGVMDLLFVHLMLWGREQGYRWFNLGMAPLSGLEQRAGAPLWNRFSDLAYRHGERFYNFQGLRHYKEKFDPVWEPRYLAFPRKLALPQVLAHLASLIAGGRRGIFSR